MTADQSHLVIGFSDFSHVDALYFFLIYLLLSGKSKMKIISENLQNIQDKEGYLFYIERCNLRTLQLFF